MESRIAAMLSMIALVFATQVAAQQAPQPPVQHNGPLILTATTATLANPGEFDPRIPGESLQASAWKSSRLPDRDTARIADAFKTGSTSTTLAKGLLYATTPLWLPRSRPFPKNSDPLAQPSPPPDADKALLTLPAFKE